MDWIRSWILQIAGIIVLGTVCDMVMPDGEIRKYVKSVVGLILVFTVIRPVSGFYDHKADFEVPKTVYSESADFRRKLDEVEQKEVVKAYRSNIEEKIIAAVQQVQVCDVEVSVGIEESDGGSFGRLTEVCIVNKNPKYRLNEYKIKEMVCSEFGVAEKMVEIRTE